PKDVPGIAPRGREARVALETIRGTRPGAVGDGLDGRGAVAPHDEARIRPGPQAVLGRSEQPELGHLAALAVQAPDPRDKAGVGPQVAVTDEEGHPLPTVGVFKGGNLQFHRPDRLASERARNEPAGGVARIVDAPAGVWP